MSCEDGGKRLSQGIQIATTSWKGQKRQGGGFPLELSEAGLTDTLSPLKLILDLWSTETDFGPLVPELLGINV